MSTTDDLCNIFQNNRHLHRFISVNKLPTVTSNIIDVYVQLIMELKKNFI